MRFGFSKLYVEGALMPERSGVSLSGVSGVDMGAELDRVDVTKTQGTNVIASGQVTVNGAVGVTVLGTGYTPGDAVIFTLLDEGESARLFMPYAVTSIGTSSAFVVFADATDLGTYYYKVLR